MIKGKYRNLLIISLIIVFITMSAITIVMSKDVLHTEHCNVSNCPLCNIINLSTEFMKNIEFININILILIVLVPLIQLINKTIKEGRELTLIELKVIQNK